MLFRLRLDLLISGHTHRYGIHPPEKGQHDYPIVIGDGLKAGQRTLIKVKADQTSLAVEMLDDSGKLAASVKATAFNSGQIW